MTTIRNLTQKLSKGSRARVACLLALLLVAISTASPANAGNNKDERYDRYRQDGYKVHEVKHFKHVDMAAAAASIASGAGGAYAKHISSEIAAKVGEKLLFEALKNPNRVYTTKGGIKFQFKVVTINHWHMEKVPKSVTLKGIKWREVRIPEPNTASLVLIMKA